MGRDLRQLLILFLPVILLLVAVNYKIDPANLLKNRGLENAIAQTLNSGKNAGFAVTMSQVDEVSLLKKRLASFKENKDIVVIGSSRSFSVNKEIFQGTSFYNASISSAKIPDLIASYNLISKYKQKPKAVILGLGPDQFALDANPRAELMLDYEEMRTVLGFENSVLDRLETKLVALQKFLSLLSPAYFQDSLRYYYIKNIALKSKQISLSPKDKKAVGIYKQTWAPTSHSIAPGGVIFPDGSRQWKQQYLVRKGEAKIQRMKSDMSTMKRLKLKEPKVLKEHAELFESFVRYLQKQGIQVFFFMPPHHPFAFDYELSLYKYAPVLASEEYLQQLATKYNVKIIGSFNPNKTRYGRDEYVVDQHHPSREATALMFREAFN